jgi:hypothetical protein
MAKFFNYFPKTVYTANTNSSGLDTVTNIISRFGFEQKLKDNSAAFYKYSIQDSDTPEIIAHKFYENSERHWIVLMFNDILDPQFDWPLDYKTLISFIDEKYKDIIGLWLKQSPDVDVTIKTLTKFSDLNNIQIESLIKFFKTELIEKISSISEDNKIFSEKELSAKMASSGLLPMYGFPSRVRSLYQSIPVNIDDTDCIVSDRSIDDAIGIFAPGAEVLRDKMIHTCFGFVAWNYGRIKVFPEDSPFSSEKYINKFPECKNVKFLRNKKHEDACNV